MTSSGVAPNTPETWDLLQQKHPKGPIPTPPNFILPSSTSLLPPELDIMSVLPKALPVDLLASVYNI